MKNPFKLLVLCALAASVAACGGGGGGGGTYVQAQPTRVSLKVVSAGAVSANLASIAVTVALPVGFTVDVDGTGKPLASALTPSGVAAGIATVPAALVSYTAPTATTAGSITFEVDATAAAGFTTGEFASLMLVVAPGKVVIPTQFTTSGVTAVDVLGNAQGAVTVSLQ